MPSVVTTWEGRCLDRSLQDDLIAHIDEIAAFTMGMTDPAGAVQRIEGNLMGPVLLRPDLLPDGHPAVGGDGFGRLSGLRVKGVRFEPVVTFRTYPGEKSYDIVFVRDPDVPDLDGRMVKTVWGDDLKVYDSPEVNAAETYVTLPSIHLRYQFETWTDLLMSWIKCHYVRDLSHWRHDWRLDADVPLTPRSHATREAEWKTIKQAYAVEATLHILDGMAKAARKVQDLPWEWLAKARMGDEKAFRLARDVRDAVPEAKWENLRIRAAGAVLKAGLGAGIEYMPLDFEGLTLALSSMLKGSRLIGTIDLAPPVAPRRVIVTSPSNPTRPPREPGSGDRR